MRARVRAQLFYNKPRYNFEFWKRTHNVKVLQTIETVASNSKIADSVNKSLTSRVIYCQIRTTACVPAKRFSKHLKYDSFISYEKQNMNKTNRATNADSFFRGYQWFPQHFHFLRTLSKICGLYWPSTSNNFLAKIPRFQTFLGRNIWDNFVV